MSDKSPEQFLKEAHDMVSDLHSESTELSKTPRLIPPKNSVRREVLKMISNRGPVTAREIQDETGRSSSNVTGAATRLYNGYLVDREGGMPYEYTVTEMGKKALSHLEENQDDAVIIWEDLPVNKSEYTTLKLIAEYSGHPKSKDLNEGLENEGYGYDSDNPPAPPRLSNLYKEGFVERTPTKPYVYWLTEDGKDLLKEYGHLSA